MDIQWLLTYFGTGYLLGVSIFGPAVFSAVLNDLVRTRKMGKPLSTALLLLQGACSLVALIFVISFVVRAGKGLEQAQVYKWTMAITFFAALGAAFLSLSYLNGLLKKAQGT